MGEEGFSSDSSLLYHRNIPSAIVEASVWELSEQSTTPNHPVKPRHLKLHSLFPPEAGADADVVTGRRLILGNADVRIAYVVATTASPLPQHRQRRDGLHRIRLGHRGNRIRAAICP
jgi:homogentisate 1,2-dioxygenase